MIKNWLIISRYNEDISWIKYIIKNKLFNKILVINKGENNLPLFQTNKVKIIKRNNIGREGETYLSFIIDNYSNLPDNIWLVQGDPFEHSPDFLHLLSPEIIEKYINKEIQSLTIRWKKEANIPPNYFLRNNNFYNIKNYKTIDYFVDSKSMQLKGHSSYYDHLFVSNYNNFKNIYKSENITLKLSEIIGIKPPDFLIKYIWSACFFVKKKNILRHPIDVYLKLRRFLLESDSQGGFQGYILERFWHYLFTGESYSTITECYKNDLIDNEGIISFNNTNKKKTSKLFNEKSEIVEDPYSILLVKKNGKILSIPGLNIVNSTKTEIEKKMIPQI